MYTPPISWSFAIFFRSLGRNHSSPNQASNFWLAAALSTLNGTIDSGRMAVPGASWASTCCEPQNAQRAVCSPGVTLTVAPQSLQLTWVTGVPNPRAARRIPSSMGISRPPGGPPRVCCGTACWVPQYGHFMACLPAS